MKLKRRLINVIKRIIVCIVLFSMLFGGKKQVYAAEILKLEGKKKEELCDNIEKYFGAPESIDLTQGEKSWDISVEVIDIKDPTEKGGDTATVTLSINGAEEFDMETGSSNNTTEAMYNMLSKLGSTYNISNPIKVESVWQEKIHVRVNETRAGSKKGYRANYQTGPIGFGTEDTKINTSDDDEEKSWLEKVVDEIVDTIVNTIIQCIAFIVDILLQSLTWFMYGGKFENYNMLITNSSESYEDITKEPETKDGITEVSMPADMRSSAKFPNVMYSPEEIFAGIDPNGARIALLDINFIRKVDTVKDEDGNETVKDGEYVGPVNGWLKTKQAVATWFVALRTMALVGLLAVLIYTGIRIMLSSGKKDSSKYKQMIVDWLMAMVILFSMHIIMAFTITAIEKITTLFTNGTMGTRTIQIDNNGTVFYTNLIGQARYGIQQDDLGIQVCYLVMYAFMTFTTYKFTFIYLKREIKMVFLTIIGPLVAFTYPIDKMADGSAQGFNMWIKEYAFNALIQPVHYIMYKVLMVTAIDLASNNLIYAVAVFLSMSEAEKIFKQIFGFNRGGGKAPGLDQASAIATGAITNKLISDFGKIGNNVTKRDPKRVSLEDIDAPSAVNADSVDYGAFDDINDGKIDETNVTSSEDQIDKDDKKSLSQEDIDKLAMNQGTEESNSEPNNDENQNIEANSNDSSRLNSSEPNNPLNLDGSENSETQENMQQGNIQNENTYLDQSLSNIYGNDTSKEKETGFSFSDEELKTMFASNRENSRLFHDIAKNETPMATSLYNPRRLNYKGNNKVLRTAFNAKNAILPERLKSSKEILENAGIKLNNNSGGVKGTISKLFKKGRRNLADKLGVDRNKSFAAITANLVGKTLAKGTRLMVQTGVGALAGGLVFSASLADGKANPFESIAAGWLAAKATGKIGKTTWGVAKEIGRTVEGTYMESKYGAKNANMMKYLELARNDRGLHEKFVKKYGIDKADQMKERYLQEYVPRGITDFDEFTRAAKYADKISLDQISKETKKVQKMEQDEMTREWLGEKTNVNGQEILNQQRVETYINNEEKNGRTVSVNDAINIIRNKDYEANNQLENGWQNKSEVQQYVNDQNQKLRLHEEKRNAQIKEIEKNKNIEIDRIRKNEEQKVKQTEESNIQELNRYRNDERNKLDISDYSYDKDYAEFIKNNGAEDLNFSIEKQIADALASERQSENWVKNVKDMYIDEFKQEYTEKKSRIKKDRNLTEEQKDDRLKILNQEYTQERLEARADDFISKNKGQILQIERTRRYEARQKEAIRGELQAKGERDINDAKIEKLFKERQEEKQEKAIKENKVQTIDGYNYDDEYMKFMQEKNYKNVEKEFEVETKKETKWIQSIIDQFTEKCEEEHKNKIVEILANSKLSDNQKKEEIQKINQEYSKEKIKERTRKYIEENQKTIVQREINRRYEEDERSKIEENLKSTAKQEVSFSRVNEIFVKRQNNKAQKELEERIERKQNELEKKLKEQQKKSEDVIEKAKNKANKEVQDEKEKLENEIQQRKSNIEKNARNREIERRRKVEELEKSKNRTKIRKKDAAQKIREKLNDNNMTDDEVLAFASSRESDKLASSVIALYNIVKSENSKALYNKEAREAYIQDKISQISDPEERAKHEKYYRNGFKQIAKMRNIQNFG